MACRTGGGEELPGAWGAVEQPGRRSQEEGREQGEKERNRGVEEKQKRREQELERMENVVVGNQDHVKDHEDQAQHKHPKQQDQEGRGVEGGSVGAGRNQGAPEARARRSDVEHAAARGGEGQEEPGQDHGGHVGHGGHAEQGGHGGHTGHGGHGGHAEHSGHARHGEHVHMPGMLHVGQAEGEEHASEHKPLRKEEQPSLKGNTEMKRGHPHLLGLGLPHHKRWGSDFQDEWSDYDTWGIDKRAAPRQRRRLGSQ